MLFAATAFGQSVSPADDAYHYAAWSSTQHPGNYIEWWYFNLYDSQHNIQGIFSYFITDPQNLTGHGLAQIGAVAYTPQGNITEVDQYPTTSFSASSSEANLQIGSNAIQFVNATTYNIIGQSADQRLQWNLQYVQQADPWFAAQNMHVGNLQWESMDWLLYMPSATITGQLTIDGLSYTVSAPGYHDHNWGEWVFSNALWNWAQYSQPGLVFDLGDFIGGPAGLASIEIQGQRTVFTKDQYQFVHTRWAFDTETRQWYPVQSQFRAQNAQIEVQLTMDVISTDPLRGPLPFPLPDVIIYEQTSRYTGTVQQIGTRLAPLTFQGNGFKEYTATKR